MKTIIVYYSLEGNTEYAAKELANLLGADLLRLHPKKAYPDGANSIKSGPFNQYLSAFLRECAAALRKQASSGKTVGLNNHVSFS